MIKKIAVIIFGLVNSVVFTIV